MAAPLLNARDLAFMLYEVFDAEGLTARPRYAGHSRETFGAALDTARMVAERHFLPIRRKVDANPPAFDGRSVRMLPEIKRALDAVLAVGLTVSRADYADGGMQLPPIVASVADAYLYAAASNTMGTAALTAAAANLIETHGTAAQAERWVRPMRQGRFAGTMAMTEPGAGSSLADILTRAVKAEDGTYRLYGSKIFISGGDHDLNENIVHLVLARLPDAPPGTKGLSLFVVPKYLVGADGRPGDHNDVVLTGLFHKMGGRGQTSAALAFGERDGAVGELVGEENGGLQCMFHMMNEARIMVGSGAAVLALTGFQYALDYARERTQGRLPSCRDSVSPPVPLIAHADVRRMLLAQKAYAEGAYALCLLGAQFVDDAKTAPDAGARKRAGLLLDLLTPVIKAWPSEYGPRANSLAIQVLGGHGYTSDHPVEMFYRDNRLNALHEGTTGIQALDLLGRKLPMHDRAAYVLLCEAIKETIAEARVLPDLAACAAALQAALEVLGRTTETLLEAAADDIDMALSNAVKYLEMFGIVVVAWLWLKQGAVAAGALPAGGADEAFYRGKLQAMRYFFRFEVPKTGPLSSLLIGLDRTCYDMQADWF
jgi:alkylation response protein AidB-like acyl-CoA dehydrogenase